MKNQPLVVERTYNAPIEKVWRALTDKDQMKQWYFDVSAFKAEPGFEFQFEGGSEDQRYLHLCKVVEVTENKKLSYTWRYEGYEGESLLTFELFPEGVQTRLKLTHSGLESFPQNNKDFGVESFTQGWTHILGKSLTEFLDKESVKNQ